MKRALVIAIFLTAGSSVVMGAIYGASKYLSANTTRLTPTVQCTAVMTTHEVFIRSGVVSPSRIEAKLCDKLIITNEDERLRLIAFGTHNDHQTYDGVTEQVLSQGQSVTVTLNQRGTYEFHDHLEATIIGYFTVSD